MEWIVSCNQHHSPVNRSFGTEEQCLAFCRPTRNRTSEAFDWLIISKRMFSLCSGLTSLFLELRSSPDAQLSCLCPHIRSPTRPSSTLPSSSHVEIMLPNGPFSGDSRSAKSGASSFLQKEGIAFADMNDLEMCIKHLRPAPGVEFSSTAISSEVQTSSIRSNYQSSNHDNSKRISYPTQQCHTGACRFCCTGSFGPTIMARAKAEAIQNHSSLSKSYQR